MKKKFKILSISLVLLMLRMRGKDRGAKFRIFEKVSAVLSLFVFAILYLLLGLFEINDGKNKVISIILTAIFMISHLLWMIASDIILVHYKDYKQSIRLLFILLLLVISCYALQSLYSAK